MKKKEKSNEKSAYKTLLHHCISFFNENSFKTKNPNVPSKGIIEKNLHIYVRLFKFIKSI